ncbi:hypothetical protein [Nocardia alni]|uniref:hypothetical protein n=1 Tax=Nocardia alni TaxID=2815723 RepID=UPI001C232658|nr:hypothetical protein [Nocardia alni]
MATTKYVYGELEGLINQVKSLMSGTVQDQADLSRLAANSSGVLSGDAGTSFQQSVQVLLKQYESFNDSMTGWVSAANTAMQNIADTDSSVGKSLRV